MLMLWGAYFHPYPPTGFRVISVVPMFSILCYKCSAISLHGPCGGLFCGQQMEKIPGNKGSPWPKYRQCQVSLQQEVATPGTSQSRVQQAWHILPVGCVSLCSTLPEMCKYKDACLRADACPALSFVPRTRLLCCVGFLCSSLATVDLHERLWSELMGMGENSYFQENRPGLCLQITNKG